MTDLFIKLFRLEKPLYLWRERPSPSAFMMNFERKFRPKKFQTTIMRMIPFWLIFSFTITIIYTALILISRSSNAINLTGTLLGALIIFTTLFVTSLGGHVVSGFSDRSIGLFDKVMRIEGNNVSWKYQDFDFFAFTQITYPNNDARYPCLVLVNHNQGRLIVGIPTPEVALRVTEILSSRMTLRTDYNAIMLEDEKTSPD